MQRVICLRTGAVLLVEEYPLSEWGPAPTSWVRFSAVTPPPLFPEHHAYEGAYVRAENNRYDTRNNINAVLRMKRQDER